MGTGFIPTDYFPDAPAGAAVSAPTSRAGVLEHLQNEFSALLIETKQDSGDTAAGFGPAIDKALRTIGTAEASIPTATVASADVESVVALAEYYALVRFLRTLATRGDINTRTAYSPRGQVFEQVKALLEMAQERCAELGYPVGSSTAGVWETGRFNTDWREAKDTAGEYT